MSAPETKPAMGGTVMRKKMFRTIREKKDAMKAAAPKKMEAPKPAPAPKVVTKPMAAKEKLMGKY